MGSRRRSTRADDGGHDQTLDVYFAIAKTMSNLHHWMAKRGEDVRFLRITPKENGEWLAIMAIYGEDGTPMVAFGSGELYIDALRSLNSSIAGDKWKEDKFANR